MSAVARLVRGFLPVVPTVGLIFASPAIFADGGVPLTEFKNGLSGGLFGHSAAEPFNLPEQLVTKGDFAAFNLNGQPSVAITGIKGVLSVSDLTLINGIGGVSEVKATVAIGFEMGSIGELEVYSQTSAGALAEYGRDPIGGVINLTTKTVPIGSHLSGPELRLSGTWQDFPPYYSKDSVLPRATWAYGSSFTEEAVGVVTEDSAFRVAQIGDSVPERPVQPPGGTGSTFTGFDSFSMKVSASYSAYKGSGDLFNGVYTYRFSDSNNFIVAENYALARSFGLVTGVHFHGDREVIFGTEEGIYRGDAEGATPAENILPNGTEYEPGKFFNSGLLYHVAGDLAAISGSGDNTFLSTIWTLDLVDLSVQQIVQQDEEIPGGNGDTFGFVQRPGVSDDMVVFEAFDQNFLFRGLYARMLDTWELHPVIELGDIFDGREVRTIGFVPDAVEGPVVGFTAYYTDNSSGAYLVTMTYKFDVPALNLSTRFKIGNNPDELGILGFINLEKAAPPRAIGRDLVVAATKKVILRAIGPSLGDLGVANPLADPVLELHDATGALIASNDDWREDQEQEIIDTTIPPNDDLESAIVADLEPGAYTAVVQGKNGETGVGLVEIYDLDGPATSELANISTRSFVQTGEDVMIGGVIVGGAEGTGTLMVVRAIGPSLTALGVANALQDPLLELYDSTGALLASNDDWKETQQSEIEAAGLAPTDDRESALQTALVPGAYTAIVRGKDNSTGIGLVEAYNLGANQGPVARQSYSR